MGLFDIFKSEERIEENYNSKTIKTLYDIFTLDLENLPDDSFTKGETEKNESSDYLTNYRKNLNPKELGLFDSLEIKVFENSKGKNFIFGGYNFNTGDIYKVQQLIDNLFLINGTDDLNAGKFTKHDESDLKSDYWTGRMWCEEKYTTGVMIAFDSDTGLSMTIWTK
ncbi:MAG: hypothetical protein U1C46_01285 [Bacteroidales bacterium]|nr:hypothetical protein [Bacteroidales bacterium]